MNIIDSEETKVPNELLLLLFPKSENNESKIEKKLRRSKTEMEAMTPEQKRELTQSRNRYYSAKYAANKKQKIEAMETVYSEWQQKLKRLQDANEILEMDILGKVEVSQRATVMEEVDSRKQQIRKAYQDDNAENSKKKELEIQHLILELNKADYQGFMLMTSAERSTNNSRKCRLKKKLVAAKNELNIQEITSEYEIEEQIASMLKNFVL
ncbi:hypothetical protein CAEBREN_24166 [Caenorhabditis brenneri]|uniref:BZIP domain-containing protein n=1 Tax=Caenorhabditis brenneri TaxID=135651 RepID=G0P7P1_CAEBE|nr:hypothetical protein CAEBREN_24166 [Caenorhabditis brenneri]